MAKLAELFQDVDVNDWNNWKVEIKSAEESCEWSRTFIRYWLHFNDNFSSLNITRKSLRLSSHRARSSSQLQRHSLDFDIRRLRLATCCKFEYLFTLRRVLSRAPRDIPPVSCTFSQTSTMNPARFLPYLNRLTSITSAPKTNSGEIRVENFFIDFFPSLLRSATISWLGGGAWSEANSSREVDGENSRNCKIDKNGNFCSLFFSSMRWEFLSWN